MSRTTGKHIHIFPKKCGMIYLGSIKTLPIVDLKACQDFILVMIPLAQEDEKKREKKKNMSKEKI